MDRPEQEYIARCKKLIEEKYQFGNGRGELRQRDLEYLADSIEERSGIVLSLSTLKRLWKKDYNKTPHPSTLQALVSLLGYKDWQEFKLKETLPPGQVTTHTPRLFKTWMLAPMVLILGIAIWLIAFRSDPSNKKPVVMGEVLFTGSKTVSQGVPNTIIFNYDVKNVKADSFFFQQSWNSLEKVKLDPKNNVYTAIYFYPGFHRAKLIANDSIIKKFRVHITTDGWFPLSRTSAGDTHPIYIQQKDKPGDSVLHFSQDEIAASGVNIEKDYSIALFNVRDYNAHSDNFKLESRIKSDRLANVPCPGFEVTIMTEEHIYFLHMMGKGCERNINIKMGEVYKDGKDNDLSVFGRDLYQWQNLEIKVENKLATIYLDQKPVYSLTYKNDFGKIVGLSFRFAGTGAVDYVRLSNGNNQQVYADEFN